MQASVTTRFGTYVLRFGCEDQGVLDLLELHFHDYISDARPDVSIIITVVTPEKISTVKNVSASRYANLDKTFNFGPNLIEGRWDFPKKYIYHCC